MGLLWISTENGLCRYDGYSITPFAQRSLAWRGEIISAPDGLLYSTVIDHPDSLVSYNPFTHQRSGVSISRVGKGAQAPFSISRGFQPAVARGRGIYAVENNKIHRLHDLASPVGVADRLVFADSSGYVLYRAGQNAFEQTVTKGASLIPLPFPITSPSYHDPNIRVGFLPQTYTHFHYDRQRNLWVITEEGLWKCPAGGTQFQPYGASSKQPRENFLAEDRRGNLILGHLRYFNDQFTTLRLLTRDGRTTDLSGIVAREKRIINFFGRDFTQCIAVASYGGVLLVALPGLQDRYFQQYLSIPNVGPGEFGKIMRGLVTDSAGNLYSNLDAVDPFWFRIPPDRDRIDTLVLSDGDQRPVEQHGCGTNLLEIDGAIYGQNCVRGVLDTGHLYRYVSATDRWDRWRVPDLGQVIRYTLPAPDSQSLLVFCEDRVGGRGAVYRFWLASETFEPLRMNAASAPLAGYPKQVVYHPPTRQYLIASTTGLYRFNLSERFLQRVFIDDEGLTNLSAIHLRPGEFPLVGSFGRGLLRYDYRRDTLLPAGGVVEPGEVTNPEFLELPSNDVAGIAERDGLLVITTFNGLVVVSEDGKRTFTRADGLPNNEFNTTSLHFSTYDSTWWAGGVNGFVNFRPQDVAVQSSSFTPRILRYSWLDERAGRETGESLLGHSDRPLVVPPEVPYFNLHYTIPDYTGPAAPLYETRLVGHDPLWRSPTTRNAVRYTRLPAGDYEFQLRAVDAHGRPSRRVATLGVVVLKPWYERTWFRLLFLGLIVLVVYYFIRRRIRTLQRANKAQRAMHQLEMRNLRQQLNPHFVSNAALAIRDFILKSNPTEAAGYLDDFTRLMRSFLEASRSHFVPLSREIDLLRRYVRLERIRFPDTFNFELEVDPDLDPEMEEVPSLLVQPIVENAINHGLVPLGRKGLLRVSFLLAEGEDDVLLIRVSDTGIGRKAAAARPRKKSHVSRATQILEDRQALMAGSHGLNISVKTEDLYPGGVHTGTVVTLRLEATPA